MDSGSTHKLILKEVSAELAGTYSCKVTNDLGADSCQATFTVNSKFDLYNLFRPRGSNTKGGYFTTFDNPNLFGNI